MGEAAQELIDRLLGDAAPQIPQREIDRRAAARLRPGASEAYIGNEIAVNALDLQRIAADQGGRCRLMDERLRRAGAEKGLAQADHPGIGMDPHPEEIGEFIEADCLNACDFHGSVGPIQ